MNAAVEIPTPPSIVRTPLTDQVEALLARLNPNVAAERRRHERSAIQVLFRLTPLDADRRPVESESTIVVGKNVSRRGLSFFHEQPIHYRRALIALAQPGLGQFDAEIDVSWCRFAGPGWYESGGRLVRSAISAVELTGSSTSASPAGA